MKIIDRYIKNIKGARIGMLFCGSVMLSIGIWAVILMRGNTGGTVAACAVISLAVSCYCYSIFIAPRLLKKAYKEKENG